MAEKSASSVTDANSSSKRCKDSRLKMSDISPDLENIDLLINGGMPLNQVNKFNYNCPISLEIPFP